MDFDDGDIGFDGDLADFSSRFDYAIARVRVSASSFKLTVPVSFTTAVTFEHESVQHTLEITFAGDIVAVGLYDGAASASSLSPTPVAMPWSIPTAKRPRGGIEMPSDA